MVYKITDKFPDKEKYSLIDQMRRAVVSLTSNVAEGFSRRSSQKKKISKLLNGLMKSTKDGKF